MSAICVTRGVPYIPGLFKSEHEGPMRPGKTGRILESTGYNLRADARLKARRRAYKELMSPTSPRDYCTDRDGRKRTGGYIEPGSMNAHKGTGGPGKGKRRR